MRYRSACTRCGPRSAPIAFVDESIRGSTYLLVAVVTCRCELATIRREMLGIRRAGQRRIHMAKAGDREKRAVLALVATLPVRVAHVRSTGNEVQARSSCWESLIPRLLELHVGQLVIERMAGSERRDRADISRVLARRGRSPGLCFDHQDATAEPALWVADAAAWAIGKGGSWAYRLNAVLRPPS